MSVRFLCFAQARDAAGGPQVELEVSGEQPLGMLLERLAAEHPNLQPLLPYCAFALNGAWCEREAVVVDGAEVAILPPVSGG